MTRSAPTPRLALRRRTDTPAIAGRRAHLRVVRAADESAHRRPLDELLAETRHRQRTRALRLGQQLILGALPGEAAGAAYTDLADDCLADLAPAALHAMGLDAAAERPVAVIALGKFGSREMNAGSDLDLIVVYEPEGGQDQTEAEELHTRWTQRLIAALTSQGEDGPLYQVDLRLRPYGAAGTAVSSLEGLRAYFETDAETWELAALTRARVAWSGSPAFGAQTAATVEAILRRPRDGARCAADLRAMRRMMVAGLPAKDVWDCKRQRGGLIDIEFAAQLLQLAHAPVGGPLPGHTGQALREMRTAGLLDAEACATLLEAWTLQQRLAALFKAALPQDASPEGQPPPVQGLLAYAAGAPDLKALKAQLSAVRGPALAACRAVMA